MALALALVPAVATSLTPTARSEAPTRAVDVVVADDVAHLREEILLRMPGGDLVALRLGASGVVAIRRGVLQDDPSTTPLGAAKVEWRLPKGDAVYLDGRWWSPLGSPGAAAVIRPAPPRRLPSGRPSLRPTTVAVAIASIAPSWAT